MRLSRRQEMILEFIQTMVREKGYPPSVREIGEAVGLASSSTVHAHLARLESAGYLRRDPTKPRAIELLQTPAATSGSRPHGRAVFAPVLGKVTAGQPITALEHVEEYFPLPHDWADGRELYLLRVQGDSMVDAGILDGDLVIVQKQATARNGDIVVAMTDDGEATVKRFFKEKDHIRLQPENAAMEPLRYENVTILGKVIGVFRSLV